VEVEVSANVDCFGNLKSLDWRKKKQPFFFFLNSKQTQRNEKHRKIFLFLHFFKGFSSIFVFHKGSSSKKCVQNFEFLKYQNQLFSENTKECIFHFFSFEKSSARCKKAFQKKENCKISIFFEGRKFNLLQKSKISQLSSSKC
jgi:hypothetical protein